MSLKVGRPDVIREALKDHGLSRKVPATAEELAASTRVALNSISPTAYAGISDATLVQEAKRTLAHINLTKNEVPTIMAQRVARALLSARVDEQTAYPLTTRGFAWLGEAAHGVSGASEAERFRQAYGHATEAVADFVHPVGVRLADAAAARDAQRQELSPELASDLAVRMRAASAALLSPVTRDLAGSIRAVVAMDDRSSLERMGFAVDVSDVGTGRMDHIFKTALASAELTAADGTARVFRASRTAFSPKDMFETEHSGGFVAVAPVGAYGENVAKAIVEAMRIAACVVDPHSEELEQQPGWSRLAGHLAFNSVSRTLLREGVVSIGQALALVLGQRADGNKDIDSVLADIRDSSMLAHVAVTAPFAVLAPLVGLGMLPVDGITYAANGRARMPQSLHDVLKETNQQRLLISNDPAAPDANTNTRTQTLRGCPVAVRAPTVDADGNVSLAQTSALHDVSAAFIDLVRVILRDLDSGTITIPAAGEETAAAAWAAFR